MVRISASIGRTPVAVTYDGDVAANPDAALPTLLLAAMQRGQPLVLDEPVTASALASAAEVQRVFSMWWPALYQPVEIVAQTRPDAEAAHPQGGTASFFSGGVDSFYSALTKADEVTHLVFVHGFDIPLSDAVMRERASAAARDAAAALGKPLLEVSTDLREAFALNWEHLHGAAMAAVGMLLEPRPATVMIPATFTYSDLFPWGSHPLLDPLWSTAAQRVVHHAAGVTRFEKTGAIAASEAALQHLRVCWQNLEGEYNCGRCAKCLRTMTALRMHGRLQDCRTLPHDVDLVALSKLRPDSPPEWAFTRANLMAARAKGDDAAAEALATSLTREARRVRARHMVGPLAGPLRRIAAVARR